MTPCESRVHAHLRPHIKPQSFPRACIIPDSFVSTAEVSSLENEKTLVNTEISTSVPRNSFTPHSKEMQRTTCTEQTVAAHRRSILNDKPLDLYGSRYKLQSAHFWALDQISLQRIMGDLRTKYTDPKPTPKRWKWLGPQKNEDQTINENREIVQPKGPSEWLVKCKRGIARSLRNRVHPQPVTRQVFSYLLIIVFVITLIFSRQVMRHRLNLFAENCAIDFFNNEENSCLMELGNFGHVPHIKRV